MMRARVAMGGIAPALRGGATSIALGVLFALEACSGDGGDPRDGRGAGGSGASTGAAGESGAGAQSGTGGTAAPIACAAQAECLAGSTAPECAAGASGARMLRRLARFEYDNTIEDLLGLSAMASERFAADTVVNGFDDNAAALVVTPLLGDQLYGSAERLAAEAVQDLARLLPCDPAAADAQCAQAFIRDFGRRAFRRPLRDAEVTRYAELHAVGSEDGGFAAGIELVLTAMLQSPNFIYRTEVGAQDAAGSYALDAYELASELAYTLTGSAPDAMLLDAAEQGALASAEQIEAQAGRLIDSPRGRAHLTRFVREWLDLERLGSVPKDAALFPEFDATIRSAMATEIDRFVEHVALEGEGTLGALLGAPLAFVNEPLAAFYGVPAPAQPDADGFGAVQTPEPQRRGVLALGGVMTTHARPDSSSPVHRGKLVRERVLCQTLAPPPPGIVVQPPPVDPELSVRERYAAHSAQEPCQSCHKLIDPVGFAFEHFDGVGRYRELDAGRAVDASGRIVETLATDGEFDGAAELSALLAGSDEVARCFTLQWMRFAYGVQENAQLACALERMQQSFAQSGGQIRELLLATTRTAHFRVRQPGEPVVMTPDEPQPDGGAGEPGPEPDPTEQPADDDVSVTTRRDSTWAAGYCETVMVHNETGMPLDWSVELMIEGTLTDHWNSSASADTGAVTFTGADHNRTVAPDGTAEFGYCASTAP
jgi:hypothetical protein